MKKPDLPNKVEIAVYSLALLGGAEKSVHSENIAAKCHEIAPSQFSWQLPAYRERGWPDKYIAKTALEDAKNKDELVSGAYALDTPKDGWTLTAEGARWFRDNASRIEAALQLKPVAASLPKKEGDRFLRSMRKQPLFKEFRKTGRLQAGSVYAFTDLLSCSPDAAPEVVWSKFSRLATRAELVQDKEVIGFLAACEETFRSCLIPGGGADKTGR